MCIRDSYAIIVMGGNEPSSRQLYTFYWLDTSSMHQELESYGFDEDEIYFLSYGDSADNHPEIVDGSSTVANIEAAYAWAASVCDEDDLLYIYWIDHGDTNMVVNGDTIRVCNLVAHDGRITDHEYGDLVAPITAKQIIGAHNPCFSGMLFDDVVRENMITITSQDLSLIHI